MAQPLWMTYWVGMSPSICGGANSNNNLTATETLKTQKSSYLTLGTRAFDTVIEACYWVIQP